MDTFQLIKPELNENPTSNYDIVLPFMALIS